MKFDLDKLRSVRGIVFDLKRFAVHDGPGIRTTVFVKGCNMSCWWCHNPESRGKEFELFFNESKCHFCGRCVSVCGADVHKIICSDDGKKRHEINYAACNACGRCVELCAAEAIRIVGKERSAGSVFDEVLEDLHYYESSGGGMTISGGEPLGQIDFIFSLLSLARSRGINTVIDTNGGYPRGSYEKILPLVDLFFFDLKQMNPLKHEQFTGVKLDRVLGNLRWLSDNGGRIVLRCPVIPSVTAEDDEHWLAVAKIARELDGVSSVEYLPYHRLWVAKSDSVDSGGVDEDKRELKEISSDRLDEISKMLAESGKGVGKG